MTRRTALLIGLTGGFVPAFASREFWNEKKPSEWTGEEIDLLLNKSPWAKEAAVSYYGGQNGPLSSTLPGTRSKSVEPQRIERHFAQCGVTGGVEGLIVRWESALPVREALKSPRRHPTWKSFTSSTWSAMCQVSARRRTRGSRH